MMPMVLKKALLFIGNGRLFNCAKRVFEKRGYEVADELDPFRDFDLAIVDTFFLRAGMAHFLRKKASQRAVVLLSREGEMESERFASLDDVHEVVTVKGKEEGEMEETIAAWLQAPEVRYWLEDSLSEFGSGLWVSLMQQDRDPLPVSIPA